MGVLTSDPLLVLFVVVAVGAAAGRLRVRGVGLGPAAALFTGLAISAIEPELAELPAIIPLFGLALFIYTVGLASGPAFFGGLRQDGVRVALSVAVLLAAIGLTVAGVSALFDFDAGARSGLFAGSQTNTPALSAALEQLAPEIATGEATDPVVGYSIAYPLGVLAMILAAGLSLRRTDHPGRRDPAPARPPGREGTTSATVIVTREGLPPLGELRSWRGERLAFSRVEHEGAVSLATNDIALRPGDLCTVIGAPDAVDQFVDWAGHRSERHLALDRKKLDFRRVSVSRRDLAGARLRDVDLEGRFGAMATRVRRGDADLVVDRDFVLRLGDRVRVVGPTEKMGEIAAALGDSDRGLSEIDALGFATGLALGLLLAQLTVPLPGGGEIELGVGGGPLIVALMLGTIGRSGPFTWQIPYAANLTIRQLGVSLFLGGVGIRSGATFADAVGTGVGARLAVAAVIVTTATAAFTTIMIRLLRRDPIDGAGMVAGIQTQPAVLAFAAERAAGDERVDTGYALVFPLAMILKLVIVQLLI
ncbi:MAG TPA: TrkA C-terminal domain-containing protein [Ilumatobacteraceae bacterium]|nr:TrkA C-terminal domain-containing protein [Ilumatobacteraceae bacterium]